MTPTQLDHLSRIKRHLKTLLANAEAGWKSTLGVINRYYDSGICREWQGYMQAAIEPILAAWPHRKTTINHFPL